MKIEQTALEKKSFVFDYSQHSLYFQTTWKLDSQVPLTISDISARVRLFTTVEAEKLCNKIKKENIFARYYGDNSFYISRARVLGGKTVIEVSRKGHPDEVIEEAQIAANIVEKVVLLSTVLGTNRYHFQRSLGIKPYITNQFNIIIGKNYVFTIQISATTRS